MSTSIVNLEYVVGQDASFGFVSPTIHTYFTVDTISWQFDLAGSLSGKIFIEGTIYPNAWETLADCEPLEIVVSGPSHVIVVVPNTARYQEYLRFRWEPNLGSVGTFDAAIRILPS